MPHATFRRLALLRAALGAVGSAGALAAAFTKGASTAVASSAIAAPASAAPPPRGDTRIPARRASDGMQIPATTAAWHLARRFCNAPTAAIVADINRMGPKAWLDLQLQPELIDDSRIERYSNGPLVLTQMSAPEVARRHDGATWMAADHALKMLITRPIFGNRHVLESTCEVLGDHLYVPIRGKGNSFTAQHEQTIRGHAMGRFADLLHAVLTQPAMLIHLDNHVSTLEAPNENLGREILELFTVGVGHFTEADMRQSTLLLTGHSYSWNDRAYVFNAWDHHVGPLRILDFRHPNATADAGPAALRAYTDYLARHPRTAERLARKFAVRFVSDQPSNALVSAMAQAYLTADTAIPPMLRVLVNSTEFWNSAGLKWRRPGELVNTIIRAGNRPDFIPRAADLARYWDVGDHGWVIRNLGHSPRDWPHVDGFPDSVEDWGTTQLNLQLWNAAVWLATGDLSEFGVTDWPRALGVRSGDPLLATIRRLTLQLTGWEWTDQDVAAAAVPLRPYRTVQAADVFDTESLGHLRHAVRLIFCSPYAFLR